MDWFECKFLESAQNLKPLIEKRTGRQPNTTIARDIAACLQQGRLFYEAAESSPLEIRPLQQFYGMVGFAKALTIARRVTTLSTLPHSHGIEDRSLPGAKIAELRVAIAPKGPRGTFQEMNDATQWLNRFQYYGEANHPKVSYVESATSTALAGHELSLKELFSRVPGLGPLFRKTFREPPNAEPLMTYQPDPDHCELHVYDETLIDNEASAKAIADEWRQRFPFLAKWALESAQLAWGKSLITFTNISPTADEAFIHNPELSSGAALRSNVHPTSRRFSYLETLPPLGGGFSDGHPYLIAPVSGLYLSEFSIHYLTLFILSTLVRYIPQTWMHALTRSATVDSTADDQCLALIEKFLAINHTYVPTFVTRVLNPLDDSQDKGKLPS